jgi:hypothetical protein
VNKCKRQFAEEVLVARFVVEIINAGKVERMEPVETSTPIRAASIIVGAPVTFRRNEDCWIKVTPAGGRKSLQFVKAETQMPPVGAG